MRPPDPEVVARVRELDRRWEARLAAHVRIQGESGHDRTGRLASRTLLVVLPAGLLASFVPGPPAVRGWIAVAWMVLAVFWLWSRSFGAEKARYLRRRAALIGHSGPSRPVPGEVGPRAAGENVTKDLRNLVLTVEREKAGIAAPLTPDAPWGVVMDMGMQGNTVTVAALADGTASIYLSTGGGFIGGQAHATIRKAAEAAVVVAASVKRSLRAAAQTPMPADARTTFYVRTDGGTLMGNAPTEDLGMGRHPLAPLFTAMQEVITQYRLLDQVKGR